MTSPLRASSTTALSRATHWLGLAGLGVIGLTLITLFRWNSGPKSPEELAELTKAALDRHDEVHAIDYAEQLVELMPDAASAWKLLAEAAARGNKSDRTGEAWQKLSELDPQAAADLAIKLGGLLMRQNQVRPAAELLHLAEQLAAVPPDCFRLQAQIAAVTGHSREAVRCLMELIKLRAFTRDDMELVTSINPSINDPTRLDAILQADPHDKSALLLRARQELDQNRLETGRRYLRTVIRSRPDDLEAQGVLGQILADFEPTRFPAWNASLSSTCETDSRIWLARAKWLLSHGQSSAAIRCLHESFIREPELLTSNLMLGQLLNVHGEPQLAAKFTERGKRLQRILDLNARLQDPRANDWVPQMIEDLEAVGRLWEAWGWCVALEQTARPPLPRSTAEARKRIASQLRRDLPRTDPRAIDDGGFDWNQFPLPEWPRDSQSIAESTTTEAAQTSIAFEDRAVEVGLDFRYVNSYSPQIGRRIFESMGGGVAVLDYDLDGWPDLYFPQGNTTPQSGATGPSDALYRNRAGDRFSRVTESAGVNEPSYSQGVAAGDYDNDGFTDLYVANLGRNRLYRNNGDGTFRDATDEAGLRQTAWTVSCAIADLDGDGFPELFDVNYVQGDDLFTGVCLDSHGRPTVCRPTAYDASLDTVALNRGDGTFLEQQAECGLDLPQGMGLGLVIADFNDDSRLDVFVANDMTANFLLINETTSRDQPLRFHDEGFARGVAVDRNGLSQACMGVACADINRDGEPDLFITNFARESDVLYLSQGGGFYQDQTQTAELRQPTFEPLGFGTQFLDADGDGWYDLTLVNGHIDQFVNEPFQMKAQFFRGHSDGRFTELLASGANSLFAQPRLGRGMALIDWNRDGRMDFIATDLEAAVLLAENRTPASGAAFRLRLVGTESSRDAIGARISVKVTPDDERVLQLTAGDGYESSNERIVHVGVNQQAAIHRVDIRWPSGRVSTAENLPVGRTWVAVEGRSEFVSQAVE